MHGRKKSLHGGGRYDFGVWSETQRVVDNRSRGTDSGTSAHVPPAFHQFAASFASVIEGKLP